MKLSWQKAFTKLPRQDGVNMLSGARPLQLFTLEELKRFLDIVHIKHALLKAYFETPDYPLVDSKELLPSFELDFFEHQSLPGFGMVALDRPLDYFQEVFQFDMLENFLSHQGSLTANACPLEQSSIAANLEVFKNRLPRRAHERFAQVFQSRDISYLENYPALMPFLVMLDRAHVLAKDRLGEFYLSGIYASFPSDLDTELKRFGLKIGKFSLGDNLKYEMNRLFVYQFLMELHGFPICSERRTSAALFARRLFKMGERFMVRVLGQTDRTITTLSSHHEAKRHPKVEKISLVSVDPDQKELLRELEADGFLVDDERRVVILRVTYQQHDFDPDNVRQERALSVTGQEVVHPLTGEALKGVNLIKDAYNMLLRLNDIVRGEYRGRITYKRFELVEDTETHEKRLKFLFSWLSKHQRRFVSYSDESFAGVAKVLDSYLLNTANFDIFKEMGELYREVWAKYSYIQQARKVKILEDMKTRQYKGRKVTYLEMLKLVTEILSDLRFEIVNYFDELVKTVIAICQTILDDRYLIRHYVLKKDDDLTPYALSVKKQYQRLVSLMDEFQSIRKNKLSRPMGAAGQAAK